MGEPTGKRRGRPPKPRDPNPPPSRGRGRPKGSVKLLAADPLRYLYALTEAFIQINAGDLDGDSELKVCEFFATLRVSRPMRVGEFIIGQDETLVTDHFEERWRHGLPVPCVSRKWDTMPPHVRAAYRDMEPGDCHREMNIVRPVADNIGRTLRLWRNAPPTNPNRRWLVNMAEVMKICLQGDEEDAWLAESLAVEIGEGGYFEAKLRPIMVEHAGLRRAGADIPNIALPRLLDLIFRRKRS
jgi:hypothetical protein